MKAVVLFSGGLDSLLSSYIVKKEGIDLEALYFHNVFSHLSFKDAQKQLSKFTSQLNIPLKIIDISAPLIELVKNPKYGYGKNLNPCIDCKILMFKKAKQYIEDHGASFIVSGEVLGERPMSQAKDLLNLIEKQSQLKGFILRPLSAKLLKSTVAEDNGWIKRDHLYAIAGRSRKPQLTLATQFGIRSYPSPSGGCLLTNPSFCRRLKDLMRYQPDFEMRDVKLLKLGRHFRISHKAKLIVARDHREDLELDVFFKDGLIKFIPCRIKGPISLGVGDFDTYSLELATKIVANYCQRDNTKKTIKILTNNNQIKVTIEEPSRIKERIRGLLL